MQIKPVTFAAIIAAAVILGLLLLSPQFFPAQSADENENSVVPARLSLSRVAPVTVPVTPEWSRYGPAGTGNFWAKIDSVPDTPINRPGTITIRGTTNVQPGDSLRIDFIANSMHPSPMEYNPDLWFSNIVKVMNGDGGVNTWSVEVRREDFKKPDKWQILINDVQSGWSIGGGSINITA